MQIKRLVNYSLFLFLTVFLFSGSVLSASDSSILEERMRKLEDRMLRMQSSYQAQIKSLQEELKALKDEKNLKVNASGTLSEEDEIAALRLDAVNLSKTGDSHSNLPEEKSEDEKTFVAGNLGLQAENPEISVTGDFIYKVQSADLQKKNSDAFFRSLGLHYETYLDPYTRFKAAVPVLENNSLLGEAYITRFGVSPSLNITLGKFRQQFGVVNRWHLHGLDFVEFPLALRRLFGDGGLNQNGVSFDFQLGGNGKDSHELTLQLTEATNAVQFGGNERGAPALLAHLKSFRDIDQDRYREYGITAMAGVNDTWKTNSGAGITTIDRSRPVALVGLDFTYLWEPADNMRYKNFLWRTEFYGMKKEILTPDTGARDSVLAWGGYTNFQWKQNRQLETGVRLDYFKPDHKKYAGLAGLSLSPLAFSDSNPSEWQISPYLTWHQSPWVRYRLGLDYKSGHNTGPDERRVTLQCIWAAGPHKHDKY